MSLKLHPNNPWGFRKLFKIIRGAFFALCLFTFLLFLNSVQTLSLLLLPFSKKVFREANRLCVTAWWKSCLFVAQSLNGTTLRVTGDFIPTGENAIIFANHQEMSDIFVMILFCSTKDRLGDLKWFVKDILKYAPGIGWGMLFLDCIFVKRNWVSDQSKITSMFSKFRKEEIPLWLISFVEGTRITRSKLERSQKFAKERNLPILNNVLLPRTKGFAATVQGLSAHTSVIYDFTIGYPQGFPSLWQIVNGTATEFHLHVRRFDLSQALPSRNASEISDWLLNRFIEKDLLLDHFIRNGRFDSQSREIPLQKICQTASF